MRAPFDNLLLKVYLSEEDFLRCFGKLTCHKRTLTFPSLPILIRVEKPCFFFLFRVTHLTAFEYFT